MNIWLINHYAVPTKYYPLPRPAAFAKYLQRMGHEVTIFAASTVHNSTQNLIGDGASYKEDIVDGIHYVYVRASAYQGNGLGRIRNMLQFPLRLPSVVSHFARPDAILSVSATPMACYTGLKLAKKYHCKGIAEVADLWPESFVAYGLIGKNNPLLIPMYAYEKRMYAKAEALIFTMEGGRDYIIDKGWDKAHGGPVDLSKVHHINNGIDLEVFDYNREHYTFADDDLDDPHLRRIVYAGAVRQANDSILILPEVAACLARKQTGNVKILVYGRGDILESMQQRCRDEHIANLVFKGVVEKKYIPYILSRADAAILNCDSSGMSRYGSSQNKLFEYLAAGKPILSGEDDKYSIIRNNGCGISRHFDNAEDIAGALLQLLELDIPPDDIRQVAARYDFASLTAQLLETIESL